MAKTLRNLDRINTLIIKEHAAWLEKNAPVSINLSEIKLNQYSILDYPDLWSGARLFETSIEKKGDSNPVSEEVEKLIDEAKKENKKDQIATKELQGFKEKYKKYLDFMKERCLLLAIDHTLQDINGSEGNQKELDPIKEKFQSILNPSSLLKLQTHLDCLQAHKQTALLCSELRNKTPKSEVGEIEKINQLEVLAKRLLDCHYERAKKMTLTEALAEDVSTVSSFVGLLTGVPAAILGIAGIFFPPLLVPAAILGIISFTSYVSSAISAAKVLNEAVQYGRSPSGSDVKWLVIDSVFAPFNLFGGKIFSSIAHALRPMKNVKELVKHIGTLWNDVISNIFPDTVETKEVLTDLIDVGSTLTKSGELKNTISATSWQKVRSALAVHDSEAVARIGQIKEEMTQQNTSKTTLNNTTTELSATAIHGRDFAFIKLTKKHEESKLFTKSFHGHILLWDAGFLGTGTSKEAQDIINAMNQYKELKPDETIQQRIGTLKTIKSHCDTYLEVYKEDKAKKGRYSYVTNLAQNIEKELNNLCEFAPTEDSEPLVLVGFKAR